MTYADAVRKIAENYKQRKAQYEQAELEFLQTDAEFFASESKKRDLQLRAAKGEKISKAALDAAERENAQIRARLALVPPAPRCKRCNDTGRTGGKFCDCAVTLALQNQSGEIGIPLHKFEEVDFSVYGDRAAEQKKMFAYAEKICSAYPANKKRCIVISGLTGNGKTYLAGCAAQKILERGMSVLALTAFAANNWFLKYHTCFDEQKASYLDPMLDCSLLIIDDLGTESILKNVTVEYLYQIINERNTAGKLTFITTNLTPDKILSRYGERIYSRLYDKALSLGIFLNAPDLRKAF